jgi:hypothetical protein
MSGALMQILAYGAQDIEIIDAKSESFFLKKHAKHAPFAIQPVQIVLPDMDAIFGQSVRVTIPRNGDLLGKVWLEIQLQKNGPTYLPAEELVEEVQLAIGGQIIDTQTNNFVRARNEIFMTQDEGAAYRRLVDYTDNDIDGTIKTFYLPLNFWFCEYARALPLLAIQMHDVQLRFKFAKSVAGISGTFKPKVRLFADFVFLGDDERKAVVGADHFIPVPQTYVQSDRASLSSSAQTTIKTQIFARNPCSYIIWTFSPKNTYAKFSCDFRGGSIDVLDPLMNASLYLNGHERFPEMPAFYYTSVIPYTFCKTSPAAGVHFASFSMDPRGNSPTGSLNMSRISSVILNQTFKRVDVTALTPADISNSDTIVVSASNFDTITIYVVTWNFLRIEGGRAGLAYPL